MYPCVRVFARSCVRACVRAYGRVCTDAPFQVGHAGHQYAAADDQGDDSDDDNGDFWSRRQYNYMDGVLYQWKAMNRLLTHQIQTNTNTN